jgi:hypothetical protein
VFEKFTDAVPRDVAGGARDENEICHLFTPI